ncbi:MAG: hypothetical protein WC028_00795 [Candidatus Obscuribacterales bacterium]
MKHKLVVKVMKTSCFWPRFFIGLWSALVFILADCALVLAVDISAKEALRDNVSSAESKVLDFLHPVLGVKPHESLAAQHVSDEQLQALTTQLNYSSRHEQEQIQSSHCFLQAEMQAAEIFLQRAKGRTLQDIRKTYNELAFITDEVAVWKKQSPITTDLVYFFGYEQIPIKLSFLGSSCCQASILTEAEISSFDEWQVQRFGAIRHLSSEASYNKPGLSTAALIKLYGNPQSIIRLSGNKELYIYPLLRLGEVQLSIENGRCIGREFIFPRSRRPEVGTK